MQPLLSILIPTVVGRESQVENLLNKIKGDKAWKEVKVINGRYEAHFGENLGEPIWFQIYKDDKLVTIGEKRQDMYNDSNGMFSWQIDDDDDIAINAIELILEAIKSNPEVDCITFEEYCNINGIEYKSKHSLEYGDWEGDGSKELTDGFHFHRTPFMKSVIRTDIAKSVPVPYIRFGEDHQWAQALNLHLKTEIHIPQQLYKYIHQSTDFNTRYGIK